MIRDGVMLHVAISVLAPSQHLPGVSLAYRRGIAKCYPSMGRAWFTTGQPVDDRRLVVDRLVFVPEPLLRYLAHT